MPNNWKKYKFSDFVDINPTIRFSKDELYSFVEMKDLNESNKFTLPSTEKKVTGGARFEERDTLFARITPCLQNGKICQVKGLRNGVGFGSTEFLIFRGKKGISDTDFVYYLSRESGVRKFAEQSMIGTSGRQRVVKDAFQNLELELPPLPEQRAIAEILSALDDKIELNLQTNKTLEEMADAIYKHWFVKFDPFKNRKFVNSELGNVPEGWCVKSFKDISTVERGLSYKGEFLANSGKPLHNLNSIYEGGHYKYPGIKYYSGPYKERNTVNPGDLIVANTEQGHKYLLIGSPALIPKRYGSNGIFSHHLYKIVPNKDSVSKIYLFHWLLQKENRDRVTAYCNGTTVNMLKPTGFENPTLIIPDKKTIDDFDKIVQPYLDLKEELIEENYSLIQTRDYLLPKLISGEIRVKDAVKKVKEVV